MEAQQVDSKADRKRSGFQRRCNPIQPQHDAVTTYQPGTFFAAHLTLFVISFARKFNMKRAPFRLTFTAKGVPGRM